MNEWINHQEKGAILELAITAKMIYITVIIN